MHANTHAAGLATSLSHHQKKIWFLPNEGSNPSTLIVGILERVPP